MLSNVKDFSGKKKAKIFFTLSKVDFFAEKLPSVTTAKAQEAFENN